MAKEQIKNKLEELALLTAETQQRNLEMVATLEESRSTLGNFCVTVQSLSGKDSDRALIFWPPICTSTPLKRGLRGLVKQEWEEVVRYPILSKHGYFFLEWSERSTMGKHPLTKSEEGNRLLTSVDYTQKVPEYALSRRFKLGDFASHIKERVADDSGILWKNFQIDWRIEDEGVMEPEIYVVNKNQHGETKNQVGTNSRAMTPLEIERFNQTLHEFINSAINQQQTISQASDPRKSKSDHYDNYYDSSDL